MRIAGSTDLKKFGEPVILTTPQDYEEGVKVFAETVANICGSDEPRRIIVGLPGILSEDRHSLFKAPHLRHWEGKDIKRDLEDKLNTTVYLENDSALVGLGEAHFGAGQEFPILAYITVSTGVGGVRIVDGEIEKSKYGFEPGHHIIELGGETRELEDLVSGAAVGQKYGKPPYEITDEKVWNDLAKILAKGLYNVVLDWSPDVIVLGGSMFNDVGIKVPTVIKYLNEVNTTYPSMPIIKKAELGDLGGLYGGMAYLANLQPTTYL